VRTSTYERATKDRFVWWLKTKLLPKLRRGDIIVMDNLAAHHDARVLGLCTAHGVEVVYLPPSSPDFNPIESAWALQKQFVRRHAPRSKDALRRIARRARHRVTPQHYSRSFEHCGYRGQTN
jgi:transposase